MYLQLNTRKVEEQDNRSGIQVNRVSSGPGCKQVVA